MYSTSQRKLNYSLTRDRLRDHAIIAQDYRKRKNEIPCNIHVKS